MTGLFFFLRRNVPRTLCGIWIRYLCKMYFFCLDTRLESRAKPSHVCQLYKFFTTTFTTTLQHCTPGNLKYFTTSRSQNIWNGWYNTVRIRPIQYRLRWRFWIWVVSGSELVLVNRWMAFFYFTYLTKLNPRNKASFWIKTEIKQKHDLLVHTGTCRSRHFFLFPDPDPGAFLSESNPSFFPVLLIRNFRFGSGSGL